MIMKNLSPYQTIVEKVEVEDILNSTYKYSENKEFIREVLKRDDIIVTNDRHNDYKIFILLDNGFLIRLSKIDKSFSFWVTDYAFKKLITNREIQTLLKYSGNNMKQYNATKIDTIKRELTELTTSFESGLNEVKKEINSITKKYIRKGFLIDPADKSTLLKLGDFADNKVNFQIRTQREGNKIKFELFHYDNMYPYKDLLKNEFLMRCLNDSKKITLERIFDSMDTNSSKQSFLYDFFSGLSELYDYLPTDLNVTEEGFKIHYSKTEKRLYINDKETYYGSFVGLKMSDIKMIRTTIFNEMKKVFN